MHAIGIDIGGTATRVGVVASDTTVVALDRFPTGKGFEPLYRSISDALRPLVRSPAIKENLRPPVGLAVPGRLDAAGRVERAVNLPFLNGRDPRELLPTALRSGAVTKSDADAATWGEWLASDSKPRRFAHLRFGSGVACGVVVDRRLMALPRQAGRHADVLVFDDSPTAPLCICGRRGCLETVASRAGLGRTARQAGLSTSLRRLARFAESGDARLAALLDHIASAIAKVVGRLADEYDTTLVPLGGGVVAALPALVEAVSQRVAEDSPVRVERARVGDFAGIVGAAVLSLSHKEGGRSSAPQLPIY